jgi:hypothetical protein
LDLYLKLYLTLVIIIVGGVDVNTMSGGDTAGGDLSSSATGEVRRVMNFVLSELELEEKQYMFYKDLYGQVVKKVKDVKLDMDTWSDSKDSNTSSTNTNTANNQYIYSADRYRLALTRHAENVNSLLAKLGDKVL